MKVIKFAEIGRCNRTLTEGLFNLLLTLSLTEPSALGGMFKIFGAWKRSPSEAHCKSYQGCDSHIVEESVIRMG